MLFFRERVSPERCPVAPRCISPESVSQMGLISNGQMHKLTGVPGLPCERAVALIQLRMQVWMKKCGCRHTSLSAGAWGSSGLFVSEILLDSMRQRFSA